MPEPPQPPAATSDYAALSAGWAALLGAILVGARDRGEEPVRAMETVPIGVATFALAKLISKEKIAAPERAYFVEEGADGQRRPRGRGVRYVIGELLTCTRCTGMWAALGLTGLRVLRPREARVVNTLLGASAVNDFLQGCFTWTSARTNVAQVAEQREREEPPSRPDAGGGLRTPTALRPPDFKSSASTDSATPAGGGV